MIKKLLNRHSLKKYSLQNKTTFYNNKDFFIYKEIK